jgi:hypothetical protein
VFAAYSAWLVIRLALFPGQLSSRGMAYLYGALALDLVAVTFILVFVAQLSALFD